VLEMRISIADHMKVASVLKHALVAGASEQAVVEDLVTVLRTDAVEILLPRAHLQELTTRWEQQGPVAFKLLRDGMFEELGIEVPNFRFVITDGLGPDSFAFRLNDITSMPFHGLGPEQTLVNDTAERLRLQGIENATATINPGSWQPSSVVKASDEPRVVELGLTSWNPIEYLVLCLAEFLRQHGWCVVHRDGARAQLEKLDGAWPALTEAVRPHVSEDHLTVLLRSLVRDRVSVKDLPAILDLCLDYSALQHECGVLDMREERELPSLLAFVRIGLGHDITQKAARNTNTLVVYLLAPELEQLAAAPTLEGSNADVVLHAIHAELAHLPPTAQVPSLLTFTESRPSLQSIIRTEQPRMTVIAHEELPPGTNVMPVARILPVERAS